MDIFFVYKNRHIYKYLKLETGRKERRRCIKSIAISTTLDGKHRTLIQNSTARQMERLFNALLYEIQTITDVKLDTFKKHLDKWLRGIPDTPKIDDYGVAVGAEKNSITKQKENNW